MEQVEEWKQIEGYSRYKVSDSGKVWDTKNNTEVAQVLAGKPQYYYVNMYRDDGERKLVRLHRLVAEAFVEGQSEEFNIVDHIDRDKLHNHYSNLRWVDHSGNQRNTEGNVFVDGIFIKDFVNKYDNPTLAYGYIMQKHRDVGVEKAIEMFEEYLAYGQKRLQVEYEGETLYLADLAESKHLDYSTLRSKVVDGKLTWNTVYNVPEEQPYSFEIKEKGVYYWYPSKTYFCEMYKKSPETLRDALAKGLSTEDILKIDGKDYSRQTVLGITGTIPELCKHFSVSEGCVYTRLTRKGWSLEKALTTPQERIRRWSIDGETKSVLEWCTLFGLNSKDVNTWKSRKSGRTFKDALVHFGIDCKDKEFQPGD